MTLPNCVPPIPSSGQAESVDFPVSLKAVFEVFTPRMQTILLERQFTVDQKTPLSDLGKRMDITRERVRQLESRGLDLLKQYARKSPDFSVFMKRAEQLRHRLGSCVPETEPLLALNLEWSTRDVRDGEPIRDEFLKKLLLWHAGPFHRTNGWFVTDRNILTRSLRKLQSSVQENGLISDVAVGETLRSYGMLDRFHADWMNQLKGFVRVDDGYVYGRNVLDKIEALLHYEKRPLSAEDACARMGRGTSRSVRQRLMDDSRFWRINKQSEFVLAGTPGYRPYSGITSEIKREIEQNGGKVDFDDLVERISSGFGVNDKSVISYVKTPMFVIGDDRSVSLRSAADQPKKTSNIDRARSVHRTVKGTYFWRVRVGYDMARGSGRLIPNAFAQELGCNLGQKVVLDSECGPVTLSWPVSSATGATIGSLRRAIPGLKLVQGDYLLVRATKPMVTFEAIRREDIDALSTPIQKVALFLGCGATDSAEAATNAAAQVLRLNQASPTVADVHARLSDLKEKDLLAAFS